MALRQSPWLTLVASIAFLALFPGFFFYHFGVGQGFYGLFLDGMFQETVILLWIPLFVGALALCAHYRGMARSRGTLLFAVLIAWSLIWLGVNCALEPDHPGHMQLFATIVTWTALFFLGLALPLGSAKFRRLAWVGWLFMGVAALLSIDARQLQAVGEVTDGVATYQQLARSMMVTSALVVATTSSMQIRAVAAIFSILVLFVIGARSELYGFIAGYALTEFLMNRDSILGRVMFFIGALVIVGMVASNLEALQISRQLEILNLSESTSWSARDYLHHQARGQIAENPLLGQYAGHWVYGEGHYSHDILSAWVSLGLPGFLIYLALCIGCTWYSLKVMMVDPGSNIARLATLMNTATLLLVFLAKPVYWELPPFAWALAIVCVVDFRLRSGASAPPGRIAPTPGLASPHSALYKTR